MKFSNKLQQLRALAIFEGISYLLFALTMPLKYLYDIILPNKIVGMVHGFLFLAFCLWVIIVAIERKWKWKKTIICLVSSLLPFATFIVDAKILKHEE